jgi:hypothetical protein
MKSGVQEKFLQRVNLKKITTIPEKLRKSAECAAAGKRLLTDVSNLLTKAAKTLDSKERHSLYLEAMEKSNRAYSLLAKAKAIKCRMGC